MKMEFGEKFGQSVIQASLEAIAWRSRYTVTAQILLSRLTRAGKGTTFCGTGKTGRAPSNASNSPGRSNRLRSGGVRPWRAQECIANLATPSHQVCYNELGDAYLERCNRYWLTRNLVHHCERLGSRVTLQQKAA